MLRRPLLAALSLLILTATGCDEGGGGGDDFPPAAIWGQFRQNNLRSGLGIGVVQLTDAIVDMEFVDDITVQDQVPSAVSGSPAIDTEGRIYVGSEGGTLAGFDGGDSVNKLWAVNRCDVCPLGNQTLGRLISSPAVYTFEDLDGHNDTSVFLGSADGAVFLYRFLGDEPVDSSKCEVCFWRDNPDLQQAFVASTPGASVSASFVSSPTFSANLGTGSLAGIFIGATITIEHSDGSSETQGKVYAINHDGSLRWEFPRAGDPPIAPVTSSPAFAIGSTLYFTTNADPNSIAAGDILYSITEAGNLKRAVSIAGLTNPAVLLSPSPMSAAGVFINGVDGVVHARNPDGTFLWTSVVPGERLVTSLTIGSQNELTPTAEPEATPTPTGIFEPLISPTPTATETPFRLDSNILGITESGKLIVLNSRNGEIISPSGGMPSVAVEGTVVASPALSSDLFMVFATTAGQVFNINSINAQLPRFCSGGDNDGQLCSDNANCIDGICDQSQWPILLPKSCNMGSRRSIFCSSDGDCPGGACVSPAIRSSPSIDLDGTIYFGADDGRIYAIDEEPTPTPSASPAATPTPRASATGTQTRAATVTASPTVDPTSTTEPTSTVEETPTVEVTPTEVPTTTSTEATAQTPSPTAEVDTPTIETTAEPTLEVTPGAA